MPATAPGAAVAVSVTVGPAWLLVSAAAVLALFAGAALWRRRPGGPADEPDPCTGI